MNAVVVFAHGSTIESANQAVRAVTAQLAGRIAAPLTETAFLDCTGPTLPEAVEAMIERGATRVIVVPYFLTLGIHLQRDLPALVREAEARHPGVSVEVTPPLDGHAALLEIMMERAAAALERSSPCKPS